MTTPLTPLSSSSGKLIGLALAPFTALGSFVRHARFFHPSGTVLRGHALAVRDPNPYSPLGKSLAGEVWLRFSGAWWKNKQWMDVLGCAVRFTRPGSNGEEPLPDDQDVLFATIRNPLTLPFAPFTTDVSDYLANDYFGVSPFVGLVGPDGARIKLRLRPERRDTRETRREQKLEEALRSRPLRLSLEARPDRLGARYQPFLSLELTERVTLDQRHLRFDPFLNGRGLEPAGVVQHARILAYRGSQQGRAAADG